MPAEKAASTRRRATRGGASTPAASSPRLAAYLDCFSGAAGNMLLGALIDAGLDPKKLRLAASRVLPDFRLSVTDDSRSHLGGKLVEVVPKSRQPERHLADIEKLIGGSGLPAPVIEKSLAVFRRLAEAEGRVHRCPPGHVHFHEVGAVDAIVDIVGTVFGFYELGVGEIICSPLPLAGGEVECAHGRLPLPAPATLELLAGVPVRWLDLEAELVTPTGAALVTTLAGRFGPPMAMTIERTGVGLGSRKLPGRPNLLRLLIGRTVQPAERMMQLEAAIDDMPGEHFEPLMEKLHEAGAVEVLFIPVQAKKHRPAVLVRALARLEDSGTVMDAILNHSTSLGVRGFEVQRKVLPREVIILATPLGKVRIKKAVRPDGSERLHIEYDDLKKAAARAKIPVDRAEREIWAAWRSRSGE